MRSAIWLLAAFPALGLPANLLFGADDAAGVPVVTRNDNAFIRVLSLVHSFGTSAAVDPGRDAQTKEAIAAALRKGKLLTRESCEGLIAPEAFARLAGKDGEISLEEVGKQLDEATPKTRRALLPAVAEHARLLTTGFDQIDEMHRLRSKELVDWIVDSFEPGRPLPVVFVCTGNSRRSILGATLGNIAAAYYGLSEIQCYSGGTKPSAFNRRTIATLREIGVKIVPTGRDVAGDAAAENNPIYKVRWGDPVGEWPLETVEFSKRYDDEQNPRAGFAALIVCSEADTACPNVKGASVRISMPYVDPKLFDDSEFEARKYAERRDDIGRLMLAVMMQARLRLVSSGKL